MAGKANFRLEEVAQQWLVLAERRLAYYQELYDSGRWTRYYQNRESFVARVREVARTVQTFRKVAGKQF